MGKSLADYAAEARRDPFVLDLGNGQTVSIPQPTWSQIEQIGDTAVTTADVLRLLAGDVYPQLQVALADVPAPVVDKLLADMRVQFGLGNLEASPSS
jgi:hypothetical protein